MTEHMSFEEGATLPYSGVTGRSALSGIGAGYTVLTYGSGGVSLFAIQIARLCGARVIATTIGRGQPQIDWTKLIRSLASLLSQR